jgi:hypothetical protein
MKTLEEHRKQFLREAIEYDTGRKDEDFHSYMRKHNVEHLLSETQIQDRNRENNSLNGLGLVAGIAIPLTFGAIFGANKIMKEINKIGMDETYSPSLEEQVSSYVIGDLTAKALNIIDDSALSGTNTRPMPRADNHLGQDLGSIRKERFLNQPLGLPSRSNTITDTGQTKSFNPYVKDTLTQTRAGMRLEDIDVVSGRQGLYPPREVGLFPPTEV